VTVANGATRASHGFRYHLDALMPPGWTWGRPAIDRLGDVMMTEQSSVAKQQPSTAIIRLS
jgi:hypothetical protein